LPLSGHDERAFGAVNQLDPEEFLKVLDALARSALGHAMLDGRMGETALANHIVENF
jgi:hypothetical protein